MKFNLYNQQKEVFMNRIVFESDTPHGVMALMLVNAAPHLRGSTALTPPRVQVSMPPADTMAAAISAPLPEEMAAPVDTSNQADVAVAVETVSRGRKPRNAKKQEVPSLVTTVDIAGPDGQMRHYETVGEALEGMADMLDLFSDEAELSAWVAKHTGFIATGGEAGVAFLVCVKERRAELTAPVADDPLPAGDAIGEKPKPTENPPEMSLDTLGIPAALKRTAATEPPTEADARAAFLAYCEARGAPAGRKLLDKYETPKVSALKPEQRANFIIEAKAGVPA